VREEKFLTRRDMRDLWDIQKQEELVNQKIEEYENADTIPEDQMSEEGKKALQKAKERMAVRCKEPKLYYVIRLDSSKKT